jgi:hypothetical protein
VSVDLFEQNGAELAALAMGLCFLDGRCGFGEDVGELVESCKLAVAYGRGGICRRWVIERVDMVFGGSGSVGG